MSYQKTFDTACKILTRRPCSVQRLRGRLSSKGFTQESIDCVVTRLLELGYLNDQNYAYNYGASLLKSRSIGRARMGRKLREKQVAEEDARCALAQIYADGFESELCDQAIARHTRIHGTPQDYTQSSKLIAHLVRRGFPLDMIHTKVRKLCNEDWSE